MTKTSLIDLGSVHPLDAGFDVRAIDTPLRLAMAPGGRYRVKHADGVAEGSPDEVCAALAAAGYRVVAADMTPVKTRPGGRKKG